MSISRLSTKASEKRKSKNEITTTRAKLYFDEINKIVEQSKAAFKESGLQVIGHLFNDPYEKARLMASQLKKFLKTVEKDFLEESIVHSKEWIDVSTNKFNEAAELMEKISRTRKELASLKEEYRSTQDTLESKQRELVLDRQKLVSAAQQLSIISAAKKSELVSQLESQKDTAENDVNAKKGECWTHKKQKKLEALKTVRDDLGRQLREAQNKPVEIDPITQGSIDRIDDEYTDISKKLKDHLANFNAKKILPAKNDLDALEVSLNELNSSIDTVKDKFFYYTSRKNMFNVLQIYILLSDFYAEMERLSFSDRERSLKHLKSYIYDIQREGHLEALVNALWCADSYDHTFKFLYRKLTETRMLDKFTLTANFNDEWVKSILPERTGTTLSKLKTSNLIGVDISKEAVLMDEEEIFFNNDAVNAKKI